IEDRGLGMSAEEIETANEQLRNPPEFRLTSTARLGLYVVGKLAERHGIKVKLTESAYGGTTAVVLIPGTLMADDRRYESGAPETEMADAAARPQRATVGRHRLRTEAEAQSTAAALPSRPAPSANGSGHANGSSGTSVLPAIDGAPSALPATMPWPGG